MYKYLVLLALVGAALAGTSPSRRRCSRYTLANSWESKYLNDAEWYVVASTPSGSVLSWNTEYQNCDSYFTYGTECCGSCSFVRFFQNPKYTQYPAHTMVQYSYNDCKNNYDVVENFFGPAYGDANNVYRSYTRELFDRKYLAYADAVDPAFLPYDTYANDYSYSVGVLGYCAQNKIVILVVCNNFSYLNYVDYPTVIVLAQHERLNLDQKKWVMDTLEANKLCPYGIVFRNNFACKPRGVYSPSVYW